MTQNDHNPTAENDYIEQMLTEHEPVIGATYLPGRGPRGAVVGCACMTARDYAAAGFKVGMKGWRAHVAAVVVPPASTNAEEA